MSEPLTLSRLPALTDRFPPLVRLVPLNVWVVLKDTKDTDQRVKNVSFVALSWVRSARCGMLA
jgi:hypothetical protein